MTTIDWRALFGKYMLAADDFEYGAGDAPALLDGYVSDAEMAEIAQLHAEVFARRPAGEREPLEYDWLIPTGMVMTFPVTIQGESENPTVDKVLSVEATPVDIVSAHLDQDAKGEQVVVVTAIREGDATLVVSAADFANSIRFRVVAADENH